MAESFFKDGEAYERFMGRWSRAAGEQFIDWLAVPVGQRWLDVGCGTGAFTELVIDRCKPAQIGGIDPSEDQIAYARSRPTTAHAAFRSGAGIAQVATRAIDIEVSYADFDDFWTSQTGLPNPPVQAIRKLPAADVEKLKSHLRETLPRRGGRIAYPARANAVKGVAP